LFEEQVCDLEGKEECQRKTSNDFTRCLGSVRECVEHIPYTGFRYGWIEDLYRTYLAALKEKANCNNFEQFYMDLVQLEREEKLELASASSDVRERMARSKGTVQLNKVMEDCLKKMLREGKISKAKWMYRKV